VIAALARVPVARLARTPRSWLPVAGWALIGLAMAAVARSEAAPNGADHVLVGAFGALVVPLLAYAIVGGALGGGSLRASIAPTVAFGAPPARSAAVTVVFAALVAAGLSAGLGALLAAVAHGLDDPPVARDALVSAYAGALGGGAYAAFFALGASFGRRGGGRTVLLVADWVLGSNSTALALVTPRGHLRNVLGGAPPWALGERGSAIALVALALLFATTAVGRTRRP
jgi:hypothetical protein